MKEKEKENNNKENTTQYGEFVCSLEHWLPIQKQKNRAEELNKITKNNK